MVILYDIIFQENPSNYYTFNEYLYLKAPPNISCTQCILLSMEEEASDYTSALDRLTLTLVHILYISFHCIYSRRKLH